MVLSHVFQEGRDHYIKLHDDCPIMFARCIQYLYDGVYEYPDYLLEAWPGSSDMVSQSTQLTDLVHGTFSIFHNRHRDDGDQSRIEQGLLPDTTKSLVSMDLAIEKCRDVQTDRLRARSEVDISMYQLAFKYSIPSLEDYALLRLWSNWLSNFDTFEVVSKMYPDYDFVDDRIKRVIAYAIERNYRMVRTTNSEAAAGVRGWLRHDDRLCFMVMDRLARFSDAEMGQVIDE